MRGASASPFIVNARETASSCRNVYLASKQNRMKRGARNARFMLI
jgi:hypothetical protein